MVEHCRQMGEPDRAIAFGQRALALAEASGEFATRVITTFWLGTVYLALGDDRRAMGLLEWGAAALEGDLVRERFGIPYLSSVAFLTFLAGCLAERGEFTTWLPQAEEALAHVEGR
jgi:hypothetical protein